MQKYTCPFCGQLIDEGESPCHNCGNAISWDGITTTHTKEEINGEQSQNQEESPKKEGKPWGKIIGLLIFCFAFYSCFLAGPSDPYEALKDLKPDEVRPAIVEYMDDLDDPIEKRMAGYQFADALIKNIKANPMNAVWYKDLQFDLDKYPDLAVVNRIGTLGLRYDFGQNKGQELLDSLTTDRDMQKKILDSIAIGNVQMINIYVPGKLTNTDYFLGMQYEYIFGHAVPDIMSQPICVFTNNPDNMFNHVGVYWVKGIPLNETTTIHTANGFEYQTPKVFALSPNSDQILEDYKYVSFLYPGWMNNYDRYVDNVTREIDYLAKVNNKLMEVYGNSKALVLTLGKDFTLDSDPRELNNLAYNVQKGHDCWRSYDMYYTCYMHPFLEKDVRSIELGEDTGATLFNGNIKFGFTKDKCVEELSERGYYFNNNKDGNLMLLSPNSDEYILYFSNDRLTSIMGTRENMFL